MTNADRAAPACIARRDFMIAGAGATTLAAGLAAAGTALAQAGPGPATPPGPAKPGNILVERRGSVLLIGIERPEAQNRFDAPMLIGLGKAYYQLDHEDELRAAVLYGVGRDFPSASTARPLLPRKHRASSRPRIRITSTRSA